MSRSRSLVFALCALLLAAVAPVNGQKSGAPPKLNFVRGPANAPLGSVARLAVPAGCIFLDANSARLFLETRGEPVTGREVGFLTGTNQHWSALFIFDENGYVKDDEQDKLDADKLLESIKQGAAQGNKERQRNGNPPVEVVGWELPPKYDSAAHSLGWAIRGRCQGRPVVNYNTRLLGRKGVMEVILVVAPESLPETLPVFRKVLAGCAYQPGQTYAEYRPGDRVAKYGLGALVVSGAAAGARSALASATFVLGALVVGGAVAAAAFLKKPSSRRTRRPKK
jgi:uncharacterized membrane-anchored protein